ncbi:zinc finger protein 436-like isoform X2 [Belonocnema kinseyi]|nr:zinc finger protein 436-like isoform X2 [Belonocnema kinseyi]
MTNTQILGQDQPQEEIHFTELLPVEQFRIQEATDDTAGATDALKALRSFSQGNDELNSQEFQFYKFDEVKTLNGCKEYPKKRRSPRWTDLSPEEEALTLDDDSIKKVSKNKPKKKKKMKISNGRRKDNSKNDKKVTKKKGKEAEVLVESSVDSDYLNQDIEDEIYAFQHDPLENNVSDDFENEVLKKRKTNKSEDTAEKNLREKIDAIIQANYRLEQENNNVVQADEKTPSPADSLEKGTAVEKQPKKYTCWICSAKFKGGGGLRNHYKVAHANGPLYKCNECGKEFPLKERLKLHLRTHTGFKPYKCSECDKSFARGGQLMQHRRTHSQVKPFHCALCAGTFTCAANLTLHMKRHNGQKDHKCEICGRGFVRRDALKKHMDCLHHDVKSFLCVICNKTLKGHLPQHMRTHAQDRPHGCATCGQRFAQKSQLTVHQRTHSGQRPFRCLVCWQAFAHSTALKLHTRRHTGERPFKCVECRAGFTQLPHWKKHMKCIHGRNEPYCCRRCKTFFRIKSDLEFHQKLCRLSANTNSDEDDNQVEIFNDRMKYRVMPIEKMRLLLAVLLKRISQPERLVELGFGKRLIDEVLQDSLISAGKQPVQVGEISEFDSLKKNVEIFLEWTVPKSHWANFKKMKKSPEEILQTLTTT